MVARIGIAAAPPAKLYLAEWRQTKFETQDELAEAMGTSGATVSRIENGDRDWSKGYLEALAYLVGCQVKDLFQKPSKADLVRDTRIAELMDLVADMPDTALDHLIGLISASARESEPLSERHPVPPLAQQPKAPAS